MYCNMPISAWFFLGMEKEKKKKRPKKARRNKETNFKPKTEPTLGLLKKKYTYVIYHKKVYLQNDVMSQFFYFVEETPKTKKLPEPEQEAEEWLDPVVQRWFEKPSKLLEIDAEQVPVLKTLDAYEVKMLERKEWQEMSPIFGHVLFNMWKEHEKTLADGIEEYHKGTVLH